MLRFNIQDGEFLSIVELSGCGKFTIMRMIAGLIKIGYNGRLCTGTLVNGVQMKFTTICQNAGVRNRVQC